MKNLLTTFAFAAALFLGINTATAQQKQDILADAKIETHAIAKKFNITDAKTQGQINHALLLHKRSMQNLINLKGSSEEIQSYIDKHQAKLETALKGALGEANYTQYVTDKKNAPKKAPSMTKG